MGYTLNTIDKIWIANLQTDMWSGKIDANYELAIAYYEARKTQFITYWANQLSQITTKNITDFITQGTTMVSSVLQNIVKQYWTIYNNINTTNITQMPLESNKAYKKRLSQFKMGSTLTQLQNDSNMQQYINNGILPANFFAPNSNFWANLGKILEEQTGPEITKAAQIALGSNTNKLIADFTGSITGKNAIKGAGDKKFVTTDILIYDKTTTQIDKQKGTINGLDFELQSVISLSNYSNLNQLLINHPELAVWLSQGYTGGIGGINTKSFSWSTSKNKQNYNHKKFISSVQMQSHLNQLLKELGKTRLYYTADWIQLFIMFYLSERLINIISPNAIIFQTKDQWQWFSEVLKQVYFYMVTNKQNNIEKMDKENPDDIKSKHNYGKKYTQFSVVKDEVRFLSKQKSSLILKNADFANQKLTHYNDPTVEIKMKTKYTRNTT